VAKRPAGKALEPAAAAAAEVCEGTEKRPIAMSSGVLGVAARQGEEAGQQGAGSSGRRAA